MYLEESQCFSSFIQSNCRWVIGNGKSILLQYDRWIDQDPIATRFPNFQFSGIDLVSDIIEDNSLHIPPQLSFLIKDFLSFSTNSMIIGGSTIRGHPFWQGTPTGNLSIKEAWNSLRTKGTTTPWSGLIWNKLVNPRMACFSWKLMHRKTPIESWAKQKVQSIASRCFNDEESDSHLFFSCDLAIQLWNWILNLYGVHHPPLHYASDIWATLAKGKDVLGRKCAAAIFFHSIFVLWSL